MAATGWAGAAAVALGLAGASGSPEPAPPRPHVLLVVVDTLRADHTSAYGYARDTTPTLRGLTGAGARFTSAYAPSASTAPSHATLFTGTEPYTHRLLRNGLPLSPEVHTLAEILRDRGYQTAAFVSSFPLAGRFGFARGFERYEDEFDAATASVKTTRWEGHAVTGAFDRRADATTRRALRWLWEERVAGRPFLLFVHYFDPHAPYDPPPAFAEAFALDEVIPKGTRRPRYRHQVRNYDREIAFADREVGRLLDALEREGLTDETLVVFTADHGEGLLDHGVWTHGLDVYEESVRVPLVLRWPGRVPARSFDAPVALVDLLPTLLDLLGLEAPRGLQGHSLAPVLRGEATLEPERPVYLYRRPYRAEATRGVRVQRDQHAVRRGRFKFIEDPEEGRAALYDLEADPGERINLIEREPAVAAALARLLERRRRRYARMGPIPEISEADRRALETLGYSE